MESTSNEVQRSIARFLRGFFTAIRRVGVCGGGCVAAAVIIRLTGRVTPGNGGFVRETCEPAAAADAAAAAGYVRRAQCISRMLMLCGTMSWPTVRSAVSAFLHSIVSTWPPAGIPV